MTVTLTRFVPGPAIPELLTEAWEAVKNILGVVNSGEGEVDAPGFLWMGRSQILQTWNSNLGILTWISLHNAIGAIYDYMSSTVFGEAIITIYDGNTEIGRGMIK